MKVIEKHQIPLQQCKNCKSIVELKYKDLKWEDTFFRHRKNCWKCPMCKENQNYIINFDKTIERGE